MMVHCCRRRMHSFLVAALALQLSSLLGLVRTTSSQIVCEGTEANSTCEENVRGFCSNGSPARMLKHCFPDVPEEDDSEILKYLCPRSDLVGNLFLPCEGNVSLDPVDHLYSKPDDVSFTLTSVTAEKFNLSIAWEHHDAEEAQNLKGYEIRVTRKHESNGDSDEEFLCLCVRNINQRKFDIAAHQSRYLKYSGLSQQDLEVKVSTFPYTRNSQISETSYSYTRRSSWPQNCTEILHDADTCTPPQYGPPRDIIVTTSMHNDTTLTNISWKPPRNDYGILYRVPKTYYIGLQKDGESYFFRANDTLSVSIYGINVSDGCAVYVRSYVMCSGYEIVNLNTDRPKSCGALGSTTYIKPPPTTMPPLTTPSIATTLEAASGTTTPVLTLTLSVVSGTVIMLVVLVVIIAMIVVKAYRPRGRKTRSEVIGGGGTGGGPFVPYILVIYPLDTPIDEKDLIQTFVAQLLEYDGIDNVVTVDDPVFYSGVTIPDITSRELKNANIILVVCNKTLCADWSTPTDDTLINTVKFHLKHTVIAGVNDTSEKVYATIRLNTNDQVPDDVFLKSIRTFAVDKDSQIEDLVYFITRTPRYENASSAQHHIPPSSLDEPSMPPVIVRDELHLGLHKPEKHEYVSLDMSETYSPDTTDPSPYSLTPSDETDDLESPSTSESSLSQCDPA